MVHRAKSKLLYLHMIMPKEDSVYARSILILQAADLYYIHGILITCEHSSGTIPFCHTSSIKDLENLAESILV